MDVMKYLINENDLDKSRFIKELAFRLAERVRNGEKLSNLKKEDWIEIIESMGFGVDVELIRADASDKLVAVTQLSSDAVDQIMDLGVDVVKLTTKYRKGDISKEEYTVQFIELCIENAIIVVDRYAEEFNIDIFTIIDDLGKLIECADVELITLYVIDRMLDVESAVLDNYLEEIAEARKRYYEEYTDYYQKMCRSVEQYIVLMDKAFAEDANKAFEGSVELAEEVGFDGQILKTKQDIDDFFM